MTLAGRANFWPVVAISFVLLFYFLATVGVPWYVYLLLTIVALERAFLQARIVIGNYIMEVAQREMMKSFRNLLSDTPGANPFEQIGDIGEPTDD